MYIHAVLSAILKPLPLPVGEVDEVLVHVVVGRGVVVHEAPGDDGVNQAEQEEHRQAPAVQDEHQGNIRHREPLRQQEEE